MNIKEIEYDDLNTWGEDEAVCPYCGYRHEMIGEEYGGQDEELEQECVECGKTFIYTTDYSVTFTTEPYENWVLNKIKNHERYIKNLTEDLNNAPDDNSVSLNKTYYKWRLDIEQKELMEFKKQAERALKL